MDFDLELRSLADRVRIPPSETPYSVLESYLAKDTWKRATAQALGTAAAAGGILAHALAKHYVAFYAGPRLALRHMTSPGIVGRIRDLAAYTSPEGRHLLAVLVESGPWQRRGFDRRPRHDLHSRPYLQLWDLESGRCLGQVPASLDADRIEVSQPLASFVALAPGRALEVLPWDAFSQLVVGDPFGRTWEDGLAWDELGDAASPQDLFLDPTAPQAIYRVGRRLRPFPGDPQQLEDRTSAIALRAGRGQVAESTQAGILRVRELASGAELWSSPLGTSGTPAYSPDGAWLAIHPRDGHVWIYRAEDGGLEEAFASVPGGAPTWLGPGRFAIAAPGVTRVQLFELR